MYVDVGEDMDVVKAMDTTMEHEGMAEGGA